MRILYDHQIFAIQKYGGISRYFYELMSAIEKSKKNDFKTPLFFSNNYYISDKKLVQHIDYMPKYIFIKKQKTTRFINKYNAISEIKNQKFDVFHPTYYDPYFLKYIGNKPFVLTVYDMIYERFNNYFSPKDETSKNKEILCKKATKIIAISKNTKKDLIEIFGIKDSKIEVVYLGNSLTLNNNIYSYNQLPKKYILFVGQRTIYKNFKKFISSIAKILKNDNDLSVVCTGGGNFSGDEINLFNELNIKNKVFQFDLQDDELSSFYANAELFIFPSLYEGFGMPILEAFACNCPLVCANTSSLSEVAGNGAEYFDPNDQRSIYLAVKNVLYDLEKRLLLKNNGVKRLKYFSWKKTAEETMKIYESVIL